MRIQSDFIRNLFSASKLFLTLSLITLLGACGSNQPQPTSVMGYIQSSSVLNPDINGGYRPVNIKVYYLKNNELFSQANFADLYRYPDKALGDSILHISSHQLLPGQSIELNEQVPDGLKHIAVVAAFRSIDDAAWKDIKPVPEKCFTCTGPGLWDPIKIKVDRLSVYLDTGAEYSNTVNTKQSVEIEPPEKVDTVEVEKVKEIQNTKDSAQTKNARW